MAQISKEELEEQRKTAKDVLINSYNMYEKSITDALKRRKDIKDKDGNAIYSEKDTEKTLQLMKTMQKDVVDRFVALGGTEEELKASVKGKKKTIDRSALESIVKKSEEKEEMVKYFEQMKNLNFPGRQQTNEPQTKTTSIEDEPIIKLNEKPQAVPELAHQVVEKWQVEGNIPSLENTPKFEIPKPVNTSIQNYGNKIQWDSVQLPSGGECYKNKMDKVPVAYLTAYDENMIVSPNLYRDNLIIDYILQEKLLSNENYLNKAPKNVVDSEKEAVLKEKERLNTIKNKLGEV